MTITSDSFTYLAHDQTRAELEQEFHHEPTPPTPQPSQRRSREIPDWENFRAQESGIDPKEVKAEVTALWQHSDSGAAFVAALKILATQSVRATGVTASSTVTAIAIPSCAA